MISAICKAFNDLLKGKKKEFKFQEKKKFVARQKTNMFKTFCSESYCCGLSINNNTFLIPPPHCRKI